MNGGDDEDVIDQCRVIEDVMDGGEDSSLI